MSINQVLTKTGTWWTGGGSGGATALSQLTDCIISTPSSNQVLKFEALQGKWTNENNNRLYVEARITDGSCNNVISNYPQYFTVPAVNFSLVSSNGDWFAPATSLSITYQNQEPKKCLITIIYMHQTQTTSVLYTQIYHNTIPIGEPVYTKANQAEASPECCYIQAIVELHNGDGVGLTACTTTPTEQNIIYNPSIIITEI